MNLATRIERLEERLQIKSKYHWWQNNDPLIELHTFLEAHNIIITNDEFRELTGLKPLGNSTEERAQAEQTFIDFALEASKDVGITIDELEKMFYCIDDNEALVMYPTKLDRPYNPVWERNKIWERYEVTLRRLKLVDGTHLPKRENLFLWYGCVCHRWRIERQKKYN